jgi:hypothetical protein
MWSAKPANLALFIFIGLALPGMALAQRGGGGGVPGPGTPGMGNTGTGTRGTSTATTNPNDSTGTKYRSLTGTIVELNASENSISVKSLKDGKVTAFTIFPKTKLKAEKKTELADKKDLKLEDFKPGETVEITYTGDGSVSEVRLKHEKEKKDSAESAQKTS